VNIPGLLVERWTNVYLTNQRCCFTLQNEKVATRRWCCSSSSRYWDSLCGLRHRRQNYYSHNARIGLQIAHNCSCRQHLLCTKKLTKSTITKVRDGTQNVHHQASRTLIGDDATDEWLPQWLHDPTWPTPFSVAVWFRPDQWCVFFTPFRAVFSTCCNKLDSNMVNREVIWGGTNFGVSFSHN